MVEAKVDLGGVARAGGGRGEAPIHGRVRLPTLLRAPAVLHYDGRDLKVCNFYWKEPLDIKLANIHFTMMK